MVQGTISSANLCAAAEALDEAASDIAIAPMDAPTEPSEGRNRRGLLIVLSSPSGAGKSTLSRMLMKADPEVSMSVSATTRPRRPGEEEGVHYHFVDDSEFERLIAAGEFVEWAPVFGYRYGTPKAPVKAALRDGRDILFDIDWQGTQQLHAAMGEDLVRIFLLPPSMQELERRLHTRGTDSDGVIADRMGRAESEISHWAEYDYVLVNNEAGACLDEIRTIVAAERLKRSRQIGLVAFVRDLVGPAH
jgi:guanylate kinase